MKNQKTNGQNQCPDDDDVYFIEKYQQEIDLLRGDLSEGNQLKITIENTQTGVYISYHLRPDDYRISCNGQIAGAGYDAIKNAIFHQIQNVSKQ